MKNFIVLPAAALLASATALVGRQEPSGCPGNLEGNNWEFPHLIVPVNSQAPQDAYGTQYDGQVAPNSNSTFFMFDIPLSDTGKSCELVFFLPDQSQSQQYSFSGGGNVDFALTGPPTVLTTYANAPNVTADYGTFKLSPGNAYNIANFPCPAGDRLGFKMSSNDTTFTYFQDYSQCP